MTVVFLLLTLIAMESPQADSWHGMVPLHSKRPDVEKILGPPTSDSKAKDAADYRTDNERVFVLYSTGGCRVKSNNSWNVQAGTVISFSVYPDRKPRFADLKLDESKYKKTRDPELPDYTYYKDDENGIFITVNTAEGVLISIGYGPTSKEMSLRCDSQADNVYDLTGFNAYKVTEYSNISRASERTHLDDFAKLLRRFPSAQGHIIAYAGKSAHRDEARRLAKRLKNYLVRRWRINSARLITLDGGHREAWAIELFLVPPGVTSPAPSPTCSTPIP